MQMPLEIPERLRIVWRESADRPVLGQGGFTTYEDRIIGTDGMPVRHGWYIDKKTGRKIETDC